MEIVRSFAVIVAVGLSIVHEQLVSPRMFNSRWWKRRTVSRCAILMYVHPSRFRPSYISVSTS